MTQANVGDYAEAYQMEDLNTRAGYVTAPPPPGGDNTPLPAYADVMGATSATPEASADTGTSYYQQQYLAQQQAAQAAAQPEPSPYLDGTAAPSDPSMFYQNASNALFPEASPTTPPLSTPATYIGGDAVAPAEIPEDPQLAYLKQQNDMMQAQVEAQEAQLQQQMMQNTMMEQNNMMMPNMMAGQNNMMMMPNMMAGQNNMMMPNMMMAPPMMPGPAAPPTTVTVVVENKREEAPAPRPSSRPRPRPAPEPTYKPPPKPPFVPHVPLFIIVVSVLQVGLFVWMMITAGGFENPAVNPMLGPSEYILLDAGAKYGYYINQGEWWRFFTPMFLHSGALHLVLNLIGQLKIGWVLEKKFGTLRIMAIYLISGIGGNLLSVLFVPGLISVGASACFFGFLAVAAVDLFQNLKKMPKRCCKVTMLVVGIIFALCIGLLPMIDNFAHIGGFIFGLCTAIILIPNMRMKKRWKRVCRGCCSFVFVPILVGLLAGGFLVWYFGIDVENWCPNCRYLSCVPITIPGSGNWCDTGFNFNDVTNALGIML